MTQEPLGADSVQLTNRLLARLYVAQQRHLHGAIVDLTAIGMPAAEVGVVVGMDEADVLRVLAEAREMASRSIGRPAGAGRPERSS